MANTPLSPEDELRLRQILERLAEALDSGEVSERLLKVMEDLPREFPIAATEEPTKLQSPPVDHPDFGGDRKTTATVRIRLRSDGAIADVNRVLDAFAAIISAAVLTDMFIGDGKQDDYRTAWHILHSRASKHGHDDVFFPGFISSFANAETPRPVGLPGEFGEDGWSPEHAQVQLAILSWVQRVIRESDRMLYERLFGFAKLERAQRQSPLELTAVITFAASLPAALVYACVKAVEVTSRGSEEAGIRKQDHRMRHGDADVSEFRAEVARQILQELRDGKLKTSDAVVQELLRQASPAISDLGNHSLIEKITIGLSTT